MSESDERKTPRRRLRPAPGEPRVSDKIRAATGGEREAIIDALDYENGYGKPPVEHRFPPGRSGNPKGRPKGRKNLRTVMETVITETVPVNDGGRRRNMQTLEVVVRQIFKRAMAGDPKAIELLLKIAGILGLLGTNEEHPKESPLEDPGIIDAIWRHVGMQNGLETETKMREAEED